MSSLNCVDLLSCVTLEVVLGQLVLRIAVLKEAVRMLKDGQLIIFNSDAMVDLMGCCTLAINVRIPRVSIIPYKT